MNRSNLVFSILGKRYGFNLNSMVEFTMKNQYWSTDQIHEYQLAHLKLIICHAYATVPYYKRLMKELAILPDDIKCIDDIQVFPVIKKHTILENINDFTSSDFAEYYPMERSTGGTTGVPFKYFNDRSSWGLNWATKIRAFTWGGYRLGTDSIAVLKGGSMFNKGKLDFKSHMWRWLQKNYSFNIMNMSDDNMIHYADTIIKRDIHFLRGYPSAIGSFAEWAQNNSFNPNMKRIFTTAEMLLPEQRRLIESVFKCNIIDTYGCGDGMGGASQCNLSKKYHVNVETSLMEVINPNLKQKAKAGEIGDIVLTSLHDYAMPMIRYAPEDQAILSKDACPCGVTLPALDRIIGRSSDVFHLPNGRKINGLSIPLESWSDKLHKFQIIHERESLIIVKLVVKDSFCRSDKSAILHLMTENAGEGIDIEIHIVDEIPLTKAGKHKYVISKVAR